MNMDLGPDGIRNESSAILVPHVVQGATRFGADVEHRSRARGATITTPQIALNDLIWPRSALCPMADMPIAEIIDFLVETGERLAFDRNVYLQEALEEMIHFSTLGRRVLENSYRDLVHLFDRQRMQDEAERSLGDLRMIDGWPSINPGRRTRVRAIPPRLIHVLAGNAPIVPALTVIRGALSKGAHLLKMPSNDMFTATALLRTMADIDRDHPVVRSFTAVYWRGGDTALESAVFRSQFFDKVVVWGGDAAVRHVSRYVGPGFEMVSFDPKVSVSMLGNEIFASDAAIDDAAHRGALASMIFNQDACNSSRFHFVEGSVEQVDRYCERLVSALGEDVRYGDGPNGPIPPADALEAIEALGMLEPLYRVFGEPDGRGMVVRSDEPVGFHPTGKLVNVVRVDKLDDALAYVTVATQTVGIFPPARRVALRDRLASAGVQHIGTLGESEGFGGTPHDACWPLHRVMRWVVDEGNDGTGPTSAPTAHGKDGNLNDSMALDRYRLLGRSGLRVSPLCLGTMTFGAAWGADQAESRRIFDAYVEHGGNFIDTADYYSAGQSEQLIGTFAKGRRDRLVIATKYSLAATTGDPNAAGNHRKNMMRAVEASLKRLGTDHIDLFYLHVWDRMTPVDEIMRAFDDLVRAGKVTYLGISDTPAWQVSRMQMLAELRGWAPFIALQIEYNLLERTVERELIPMAAELGLGVLPWSPLGGGLLSGKYSSGAAAEPGGRAQALIATGQVTDRVHRIAGVVGVVAERLGCRPAQVALAWTLANSAVAAPIVGARTLDQFEQNIGALGITLSSADLAELDATSAIEPGFPYGLYAAGHIQHAISAGTTVRGRG